MKKPNSRSKGIKPYSPFNWAKRVKVTDQQRQAFLKSMLKQIEVADKSSKPE